MEKTHCQHRRFLTMLFIFLTIGMYGPYSSAARSCDRLFIKSTIRFQNEREIREELKGLIPESGKGFAEFSISNYFSKEFIQDLKRTLIDSGVARDFNPINLTKQEDINKANLDSSHVIPIMQYAEAFLKILNDSLPGIERDKLEIQSVTIVFSDGNQKQVASNWHVDSFDYLTFATNLEGAGTLIDVSPAGPWNTIQYTIPEPKEVLAVEPGRAALFNSRARHFLIPGPGANPVLHRAPEGTDAPRLGIIIWFAPKGMRKSEIYDAMREKNELEKQRLINEIRKTSFH